MALETNATQLCTENSLRLGDPLIVPNVGQRTPLTRLGFVYQSICLSLSFSFSFPPSLLLSIFELVRQGLTMLLLLRGTLHK